ncbi:MAG: hydrogenase 2 operon protein HybA [Pseudomonadota bacterium]
MDINRRAFLKAATASGVMLAATPFPALARKPNARLSEAVGMLYDSTVCVGCKACVTACKESNQLPPTFSGPELMWDTPIDNDSRTNNIIKLYKDGTGSVKDSVKDGYAYIKRQCMHCVDPACVSACPVSAFVKDKKTGVVVYHKERCIGCRYCQVACPFNIPKFEWEKTFPQIRKCQLCSHRLSEGKIPACCEVCPTGACVFGKISDLLKEARKRLLYKAGEYHDYPVARVDSSRTTPRLVTPYIKHIYGENEGGGTQVLYLSGIPFDKLGLPQLSNVADARLSETIQHSIYKGMIAPIVALSGLLYVVHKNTKDD